MKCYAALFCLLGFFSLACHAEDSYKAYASRGSQEWKKLILTHHWPVSVCKMDDVTCKNLPNYWTLHGLWPDKAEMCNCSWHFAEKEIQDLLPDMNKWWPDVLHPNQTTLWKHEWEKHGTCAASLSALDCQHKYFSSALDLYKKTDLSSVLLKFQITPSDTYYRMEAIKKAVNSIHGVMAKIQCIPLEKVVDVQVLTQIEFCFTKEFQPRNCSQPGEEAFQMLNNPSGAWDLGKEELRVCNDTLPTYYPPADQLWV